MQTITDLAYERLAKLPSDNGIIRFPIVFHKIGSSFQIHKDDIWQILFELREQRRIEIVRGNGIKIL